LKAVNVLLLEGNPVKTATKINIDLLSGKYSTNNNRYYLSLKAVLVPISLTKMISHDTQCNLLMKTSVLLKGIGVL
jgi:hypothetical protein